MRQIFLKGGMFLAITLGILWGINELLPFYWGNRMLLTKMNYVNKKERVSDTFFIGGSNTFRHIVPSLFDSLLLEHKITSFNLGNDGCYPTHSYHILENLVDEIGEELDYVFITLNSFDALPDARFRVTKTKYFTDLNLYIQECKYVYNLEADNKKKLDLLRRYSISFWENVFKINMRKDYLEYFLGITAFGEGANGKHRDGFTPLPGLVTEHKQLAKNIPKVMHSIAENWKNTIDKKVDASYNKAHLNWIEKLIAVTANKGVHLIFILPPKRFTVESYEELYALYNAINEDNRIALCDPSIYPEFYDPDFRWDAGHFNKKGARVYTTALATEFKKILQN